MKPLYRKTLLRFLPIVFNLERANLYRKTLLRFLPIVFNLERANQLSLLPDKDLAYLCPLIEPYQVTKNLNYLLLTS